MSGQKKIIVNAIPMINVNTGIARYLRCLYTEMERLYRDKLEVFYFDGNKTSKSMPQGPESMNQWAKLVDLFWKLPPYSALLIRLALHFKRELKFYQLAHGFDLYHEAGFFPLKTPTQVKTIFTIHDLSIIRFPEYHPRERVLYTKLFFNHRCKQVSSFLAVSESTQNEMQTYLEIDPERTIVTPLAHDPLIFYPRPENQIEHILSQKKLSRKYFLFVGSGDPRKNIDIIPRALQAADLDIPLVVAGWSGWSKEQLPSNVTPVGYMTDHELALLYSGALALVFPSTYEGFGLPLLEAMACGCPVVTTRKSSLPEVAGEAAAYVLDPSDPQELGNLLQEIALNPERRKFMREKGLSWTARFSWQQTANLTYNAFLQVVGYEQ